MSGSGGRMDAPRRAGRRPQARASLLGAPWLLITAVLRLLSRELEVQRVRRLTQDD